MSALLALPTMAAIAGALAAWWSARHVRPNLAAEILAAALLMVTLAVLAAASLYAVAWMVPAEHALWCRNLLGHSSDHRPVAGAILSAIVLTAALRAARAARTTLRTWRAEALGRGAIDLEVSDDLYAFSVPGGNGHIVVSTAMLEALSPVERDVLFAHERAHLDLSHHRYVLLAEVVEAVCPVVGRLADRLRWALERWADETAATAVGDRRAAASAIARAALASSGMRSSALLGLGHDSVSARVDALLNPPPATRLPAALALIASGSLVVIGAGAQVHHLVEIISHLN